MSTIKRLQIPSVQNLHGHWTPRTWSKSSNGSCISWGHCGSLTCCLRFCREHHPCLQSIYYCRVHSKATSILYNGSFTTVWYLDEILDVWRSIRLHAHVVGTRFLQIHHIHCFYLCIYSFIYCFPYIHRGWSVCDLSSSRQFIDFCFQYSISNYYCTCVYVCEMINRNAAVILIWGVRYKFFFHAFFSVHPEQQAQSLTMFGLWLSSFIFCATGFHH